MFCVIYRWRLKAGRENDFIEAWRQLTLAIREQRGGLGSRLHRAEDGSWIAYAQWPDRAAWEASGARPSVEPAASAAMAETIAERFEPMLLEPVADLLVR